VLYACKAGQPQPPLEQTQDSWSPSRRGLCRERTRRRDNVVNQRRAEVAAKGAEAFDEFRQKDSRWFQATATSSCGVSTHALLLSPDVSGEGKNMADLCDPPAGHWQAVHQHRAVQLRRGLGALPVAQARRTEAEWKSAYIRKAVGPDGTEYLVGSGLYKGDAN
jgi:hypothetical protein